MFLLEVFCLSLAVHNSCIYFNAIAPKGGAIAPWPLWTTLEGKTKKTEDVDGNNLLFDNYFSFRLLESPKFSQTWTLKKNLIPSLGSTVIVGQRF